MHCSCYWQPPFLRGEQRHSNMRSVYSLRSCGADLVEVVQCLIACLPELRGRYCEAVEACEAFCRRQVEVDIFNIGVFKFKGVTGSYQVVQLLPQELRGRNEHWPASLTRGKAVCMQRDVSLLGSVSVSIPDPSRPHLHCGWYQSTSNSTDDNSSINLPAIVSPSSSITEKGKAQAFSRRPAPGGIPAPPRPGI